MTTFKEFYLKEMATKGGDLSLELGMYYHMYTKDHSKFSKLTSMISGFDLYLHENGEVYLLMDQVSQKPAAYFVIDKRDNHDVLDSMYVGQDYRRKGLVRQFIEFILKYTKTLLLGSIHSDDTIHMLQSIQKYLKLEWLNITTNEKEQFSHNEKYYSQPKWWLMFSSK